MVEPGFSNIPEELRLERQHDLNKALHPVALSAPSRTRAALHSLPTNFGANKSNVAALPVVPHGRIGYKKERKGENFGGYPEGLKRKRTMERGEVIVIDD